MQGGDVGLEVSMEMLVLLLRLCCCVSGGALWCLVGMIVRATHGNCGLDDTCVVVNTEGYIIWSYSAGGQSLGTQGRRHLFQAFPSV